MPVSAIEQRLGSYSVLEEIGRGGMGIIYRGRHWETGEMVALKTIPPLHADCEETLVRFRREAEAASSLTHRYTMPIYEVESDDAGIPFFSMKLATGGSLHQLMEKYRGRWHQIAELMVKISAAVQHAHDKKILHRDLKPGNVLFTEDYEPLVTDFGLAKWLTSSENLTQSTAVLGTPNYVAPEQAAGKTKDLTTAVDVYGLGAILFELLTGRPPFIGENPLDVLRKAAECTPDRPRKLVPSIPKPLETVCLHCLERRPERRYPSVQALADDLQRWLQGRKLQVRAPQIRLLDAVRKNPVMRGWLYGAIALIASLWMAVKLIGWAGPVTGGVLTIAVAIDDLDQESSMQLVAREVADGLKNELSKTRLVKLQVAKVDKSQSSGGVIEPIAYGRAGNAKAVLAGCVRQSGEQVRVATRLLNCATGEVIWRRIDSIPSNRVSKTLPEVIRAIIGDLKINGLPNGLPVAGALHYSPLPDAQAFYTKATELVARGNQHDLEAAVVAFRQSADMDPHFSKARGMLAFALWAEADNFGESDQIPLALSAARETLGIDPNSCQAHRVIASCYFKAVQYREALEEFWQAVELDPESAGCCQSLGLCLREMGRVHQSIKWLTRSVQLDHAHGTLCATLGESLALCGQDQQAETAMKHAIELDDRPDSQIALCGLRTWQKKFGEARQLCARIRLQTPVTRFGLELAAWIELCDGKNSEAERYFGELKTANSYQQNWEFYGAINPSSALAYLAKQSGASEQARSLAQEATKIDLALLNEHPHNPRILHDLAATFAVLNDSERALQFLKESISMGWVERRSTSIDPRFSAVANLPRFKTILSSEVPEAL